MMLLTLSAGLPRQLTFCARSVNYRNAPFRLKRIPWLAFSFKVCTRRGHYRWTVAVLSCARKCCVYRLPEMRKTSFFHAVRRITICTVQAGSRCYMPGIQQLDMTRYREQNSSGKNRFFGFLFLVQDMSKVCMHLCVHFHSAQILDTEISVPCCSAHIALRYGEVQISILV